jgi:hypothetical protein
VVHLQPLDGLAHGRAPEAQFSRQLAVVDGLARADVQHDQLVAQLPVGSLGLGQRFVLGGWHGGKSIHSETPFIGSKWKRSAILLPSY